jgi:hypothetical protein
MFYLFLISMVIAAVAGLTFGPLFTLAIIALLTIFAAVMAARERQAKWLALFLVSDAVTTLGVGGGYAIMLMPKQATESETQSALGAGVIGGVAVFFVLVAIYAAALVTTKKEGRSEDSRPSGR